MTQMVSVERQISASAGDIFALLQDPARHADFDGSGTVMSTNDGGEKLELGTKFGMSMKLGPLPYRISSKVVEFEQDRLIAWAHLGKHRWRYELEPNNDGTLVRETFDWSTAAVPKVIEIAGFPKRHPKAMEATLKRLAELVED